MKKFWIVVLCAILIAAPTVALICAYGYFNDRGADIVSSEIVLAKVTSGGKTDVYEAGSPQLTAFLSLNGADGASPKALVSLPIEAQKYTTYDVLYTDSFDVERAYTYYLSTDKNKCYYINSERQPFRIAAQNAEAFLNSDYAENVYPDAVPPQVKVAGSVLQPSELFWQYKTIGGELKNASCTAADGVSAAQVGRFDASLGLESNYEISGTRVEITDAVSGAKLFEGDRAALLDTVFPGSVRVNVRLTVKWGGGNAASFAGKAVYDFTGRLSGTPAFQLSTGYARCGDIVILSAFNIEDPKEIAFECDPVLPYEPVFYKVGQNYQALLPLSADLVKEKTTFRLTMSSSTASDILTLDVSPLYAGTFNFWSPYSKDYFKDDTAVKSLWANMDPVLKARSSFSFDTVTGGKFVIPTAKNTVSPTANYSYGMTIDIIDMNKSFIAWDNMYCAGDRSVKDEQGNKIYIEGDYTEVLAAYKGKVVYVGAQTFTGSLVVIDHGSGLMTWYTNLSSDIAVRTGDEVVAGQFISHAANGGLNDRMNFNFHVGAFVCGVPVSLNQLIENGLIVVQ